MGNTSSGSDAESQTGSESLAGSPSGSLAGSPSGSPSGSLGSPSEAPAPQARPQTLPLPNFDGTPMNATPTKRSFGAANSVVKAAPPNSRPKLVFDFDGVLSPINFVSNQEAIGSMVFSKDGIDARAKMEKIADRLLQLKSQYDLYICSQNYIDNLKKYKDFFHVDNIIGGNLNEKSGVDKALEVGVLCNETTGAVYFFDDTQSEVENVRQTRATAIKVDRWDGTGEPDILSKLSLLGLATRLTFDSPNLRF